MIVKWQGGKLKVWEWFLCPVIKGDTKYTKAIITIMRALTGNLSQEFQIFKIFCSWGLVTKSNTKNESNSSWSSHFIVLTFQIALMFYNRRVQWKRDWLMIWRHMMCDFRKKHVCTLGLRDLRGKTKALSWITLIFLSLQYSEPLYFIILMLGIAVQWHKEGSGTSFRLGLVQPSEVSQSTTFMVQKWREEASTGSKVITKAGPFKSIWYLKYNLKSGQSSKMILLYIATSPIYHSVVWIQERLFRSEQVKLT